LARLVVAEAARTDLERLVDFLAEHDPAAAEETASLVLDGLAVLERHPLMGRPAEEGLRELVISRGRSGYVALYDYREPDDLVIILAVRHQREAGFRDRP
jgi:plasmid stabilization system protein ParE